MGSGADAERRKGLGASPQARLRDEGALVGRAAADGFCRGLVSPVKR